MLQKLKVFWKNCPFCRKLRKTQQNFTVIWTFLIFLATWIVKVSKQRHWGSFSEKQQLSSLNVDLLSQLPLDKSFIKMHNKTIMINGNIYKAHWNSNSVRKRTKIKFDIKFYFIISIKWKRKNWTLSKRKKANQIVINLKNFILLE